MIALDTFAIVAIAHEEPEQALFMEILASDRVVVGSPTLVEVSMVRPSYLGSFADTFMSKLLRDLSIETAEFTAVMAQDATMAFRRYGKGQGHPAQLNFGDRMSYAVAKVHDVPLLFQVNNSLGNDFSATDLRPAHRP